MYATYVQCINYMLFRPCLDIPTCLCVKGTLYTIYFQQNHQYEQWISFFWGLWSNDLTLKWTHGVHFKNEFIFCNVHGTMYTSGLLQSMWSRFTLTLQETRSILKPSSNLSLFKLIISDQTLIKLKWFFAYSMCILMDKRLVVFWTVFFYFKVFGLNMLKTIF